MKLAYAHTAFSRPTSAEAARRPASGIALRAGFGASIPVSGGSEAIEAALKMARQYFIESGQPQRQRFIARRQSYHGNTLAVAVGGNAAAARASSASLSSPTRSATSTPAFAYRETNSPAETGTRPFVRRLVARAR